MSNLAELQGSREEHGIFTDPSATKFGAMESEQVTEGLVVCETAILHFFDPVRLRLAVYVYTFSGVPPCPSNRQS